MNEGRGIIRIRKKDKIRIKKEKQIEKDKNKIT